MNTRPSPLRVRSRNFAVEVTRLYTTLPRNTVAEVFGKQVLRSGISVGAHLCEASRSRSRAEMINKLEEALQEIDETIYWFDLLVASDIVEGEKMSGLLNDADEISAMLVSSIKTLKASLRNRL